MKIYWENIPTEIIGLAMDLDKTVHGWTKQHGISIWYEDDSWNFTIMEDGRDLCVAKTVELTKGLHYDIEEDDICRMSIHMRLEKKHA